MNKSFIRKRMAMARFKRAILLAKQMDHTLIAYEVFEPTVSKLKSKLKKALQEIGVSVSLTDSPSHISVAQIPGSYEEELLEKLLLEGKSSSSFQGSGLVFLEGTEANFIAIHLNPPAQYQQFQKGIDSEVETRKFPGGFKSHISLVKAPKDILTKEVFEKVKDSVDSNVEFVPTKILLFNKEHKVEHAIRL